MAALDALSGLAGTLGLFDGLYRIMRRAPVSAVAARNLIGFWRRRDGNGNLVHDFRDSARDPAFLGDLYQDLSEVARREYALVQTPGFVANLIVDRTVPACHRHLRCPRPAGHRSRLRFRHLPAARLRPHPRSYAARPAG